MKTSLWLGRLARGVLALGGALLTGALVLQVVLRYLFQAPLFGIEELARTIAMWLYFIGSAYALVLGDHICSDIRDLVKLSAGVVRKLDIMVAVLTVAGSVLIAWYAGGYAWWVYQSGELTPGLWWPRYILVSAAAFGGYAMTLIAALQLFGLLTQGRRLES